MDENATARNAGFQAAAERCLRLHETPRIREFLSRRGELHIACENRPIQAIESLVQAGHRHFAEKYCQEMVAKWSAPSLRSAAPFLSFFGAVQTNKARRILAGSDSIEGIASLRSAERLRSLEIELGLKRRFFLQVNISGEPQKNGCMPDLASSLLQQIRAEVGLDISGVMILPMKGACPAQAFRWARTFADRHHLQHCAMGMSGDYELAIDHGATIIRIGRLVWG